MSTKFFTNTDQNTLSLIGIDDTGNILGLHDDYSTFGKDKNHQDEWVKHFDNITSHAFGDALTGNINLEFAHTEGKSVALIDVNASSTYIYMRSKAENRKQFYIRRNGSTVEIRDEEILTYVKQKWG